MLDLLDVDAIVLLVRADPFDPDDALLEIDRDHQTIIIAFDIEHDPICRNDTSCRIVTPNISGAGPAGLFHLIEPSIKRGLQRGMVLLTSTPLDEGAQAAVTFDLPFSVTPRGASTPLCAAARFPRRVVACEQAVDIAQRVVPIGLAADMVAHHEGRAHVEAFVLRVAAGEVGSEDVPGIYRR